MNRGSAVFHKPRYQLTGRILRDGYAKGDAGAAKRRLADRMLGRNGECAVNGIADGSHPETLIDGIGTG